MSHLNENVSLSNSSLDVNEETPILKKCLSPELFVETSLNFSSLPKEVKKQFYDSECIVKEELILPDEDYNESDDGEGVSGSNLVDLQEGSASFNNLQTQSKEDLIRTPDEIDCPIPVKKKRQRVAVKECNRNRKETGEFFNLYKDVKKDKKKFHAYMGMELETFDYILNKLRSRLTKAYTNWNVQPILPEERLVVFLRYVTVGMSFSSLASTFKLGSSTVNKIISETANALWEELQPVHMPVPTPLQFKTIADNFESELGFPHALGVIDGRHVRVKCPDNPESLSHKSNYSVVLHTITGAKCQVLMAAVGCLGKCVWDRSFTDSPLYEQIKNLKIPAPTPLPNTQVKAPYEFLGPQSYPLLNFVLRPYSKLDLQRNPWKADFNTHFDRACQVSDRMFHSLASHWKLLSQSVSANLPTIQIVLKCICVLHNLLLERESVSPDQEAPILGPSFRLHKPGPGNEQAKQRRDVFGNYFAGKLPAFVKVESDNSVIPKSR